MSEAFQRQAAHRAVKWEALAGIFGWVWIIGGIAALVFAGKAMFASGSWWNAGYAMLASSLGKFLAAGFEVHKKRVLFENEMIGRGMTAEESYAAWLQIFNRK